MLNVIHDDKQKHLREKNDPVKILALKIVSAQVSTKAVAPIIWHLLLCSLTN